MDCDKLMLKPMVPWKISPLSKSPKAILTHKTQRTSSSGLITFYIIFLKYPPNAHRRHSELPLQLYELCWFWVEFLWLSEEKASASRGPELSWFSRLAPESLLCSVAKNAGWEGLITKASNPDSNLQKYGEVQTTILKVICNILFTSVSWVMSLWHLLPM